MNAPIYLDHNATTPPAPEVVDAMHRALTDLWGNPSSAHAYGRAARVAVETARSDVARLLCCDPDEILFTGGGTEADNLAVLGVAEARAGRGIGTIVITNVEHAAIEEPCAWLEARGWSIVRVPVGDDGRIDAGEATASIDASTTLVSVMLANNETGVLQPVAEIARACRERGVPVHSDAAQAVGKMPVRVDDLGIDLLTVAGHKFYGPKGVGALYVRRGTPLAPVQRGAGHERGLRPGTEPVAAIVGLGVACRLAADRVETRARDAASLRDRLERGLREAFGEVVVHGETAPRLPNTSYVALPGVDANAVVAACPGVAMGSGAACHSGTTTPSRVLAAMGVDPAVGTATLRLTVGASTRDSDVDEAVRRISEAARSVRAAVSR